MRQYNEIKAKYPDAILLFRVGDFYETFGDDAVKASKTLGIVLTKRANGAAAYMDLAGFPYHSLEVYLPKLVRAGYRVAVCEQLEDPKLTKKIVRRGITELVTPGVAFSDNVLESKNNNYLAALVKNADTFGVAFLDVSTGDFYASTGGKDHILRLMHGLQPSEVLVSKNHREYFNENFAGFTFFAFDEWVFARDYAIDLLTRQFETSGLKGFGINEMPAAVIAAGACLHYVNETRQQPLSHLKRISRLENDQFVWLDRFTIRNLELVFPLNENGKTLLDVMDKTLTPMGSRLLRRWIIMPLKNAAEIKTRHDQVDAFLANEETCTDIADLLQGIGDLERLVSKASVAKINPREVLQIATALENINGIIRTLESVSPVLSSFSEGLDSLPILSEKIRKTLSQDPPSIITKGGAIGPGVEPELDELRSLAFEGKDFLARLQKEESERTGISSLKVGFNNVFGYYLEVTNTHKDKVPGEWIRKQTLTNAERYITPELKEYEEKILGAEEKIMQWELRIFNELIISVIPFIPQLQKNARLCAEADVLLSFANLAKLNHYCRPVIDDSFVLDIRGGRHPVIETLMPPGEKYIDNDLILDPASQQIIILTGPNMAGKSALLRQTALITLMAQIGSFVPAREARIGIADKIFTRVGASDNLSQGESTFMMEMTETAGILNNLSSRSLILLDEIGRGTSTYDGISIAWSIVEYLHNNAAFRPRTLFATHYHELNEMASYLGKVKNFHISIKESGNKIIFLRKLVPGGTEHSFGIHVARMAGVPQSIVQRSQEMLHKLESGRQAEHIIEAGKQQQNDVYSGSQLSIFQLDDPLLENIRDIILDLNIDNLTPVEALMKLHQIKSMLKGK